MDINNNLEGIIKKNEIKKKKEISLHWHSFPVKKDLPSTWVLKSEKLNFI